MTPPTDDWHTRWEQITRSLENLIEAWIGETAPEPDRDWTHQMAAITLAAQRTAGLRATLSGDKHRPGDENGEQETIDPEARKHWEALLKEEKEQGDADKG